MGLAILLAGISVGTLLAGALMVGEISRQGRRPWEGESLTLSLRPALPRPHIHDRWGTLEGSVGGRAVRLPVSLVRERGSEGLRGDGSSRRRTPSGSGRLWRRSQQG